MKTLFYILLSCCVQFNVILSMPSLDIHFPSRNSHPNMMRLQCIVDGFADPNGRFEMVNSTDALLSDQPTDANEDYLTYKITADSEARIRCNIDGQQSEVIEFAAIPNVSNETLSVDVFHGTYAVLPCPIPLPTIRSLYKYTMWEQILHSTPIELRSDSEEYMLSQDNTTLSVFIPNSMDERLFRCKMKVRRCSREICGCLDDIVGPWMEFNVLEIEVFPPSLMVTDGDTALFHCNAAGGNISVSWVLNGSACGPDICEQNGTSIYRTITSDNSSLEINTTLEIRTDELSSVVSEEEVYTIDCIVEQHFDNSLLTTNRTVMFILNPVPLSCLVATPGGGQINVSWIYRDDLPLTSLSITYVIIRQGGTNTTCNGPVVELTDTSASIPSLVAGYSYVPMVTAANVQGSVTVQCPQVDLVNGIPQDPEEPEVEILGGGHVAVTVCTLTSGLQLSGGSFYFILTVTRTTRNGDQLSTTTSQVRMNISDYTSGEDVTFDFQDLVEGDYTFGVVAGNEFGTSGTNSTTVLINSAIESITTFNTTTIIIIAVVVVFAVMLLAGILLVTCLLARRSRRKKHAATEPSPVYDEVNRINQDHIELETNKCYQQIRPDDKVTTAARGSPVYEYIEHF